MCTDVCVCVSLVPEMSCGSLITWMYDGVRCYAYAYLLYMYGTIIELEWCKEW